MFPNLPQAFIFVLLWFVPAATWSGRLPGAKGERLLSAAGLALLLNPWLALLIHYLPGPIGGWALAATALIAVFLPLLLNRRDVGNSEGTKEKGQGSPRLGGFGVILGLALALRLISLGYSEFQGDEGVIMVRAAAAITGDDQELFLHQKGPMEILLPILPWAVAGSINEFWARLPFTWASLLSVAAVMLLTRRWLSSTFNLQPSTLLPLLAGLLMAVNGFSLAFGRIVQYQSLVTLWGALALLHADRYRQEGRRLDLLLVAVFLAGGLLAHYDAVLVMPAVAWLLWRRLREEKRLDWRAWTLALAGGAIGLGVFYLPYVLNANFARTGRYLLGDRVGAAGGDGWLHGSGATVWQMVTFYNSTYTMVGLIGLAMVGVATLGRRRQGMAAVLYGLVPLIFYTAVVVDPRTHVYTFFPGLIILATIGAGRAWAWLRAGSRRVLAKMTAILLVIWLGLAVHYVYLIFVDHAIERQRVWPAGWPSFYRATWAEPPHYGLFGFPHQAGWRVAADLLTPDQGPYASNEEEEVTNWYMAQAPRTYCPDLATFFLAGDAQDEVPYDPAVLTTLHLQRQLTVNGRSSLRLYGRQPATPVDSYEAAGRWLWRRPAEVAPPVYEADHLTEFTLGGRVRLMGYDLETAEARPGGHFWVRLYWQALAPFDENYQVFVHLYDGAMRGQHDGAPECAMNPTTRWEPGQLVVDPHLIPIAADAPAGRPLPVLVGMYNLITGERLLIASLPGNAIHLTDLVLQE